MNQCRRLGSAGLVAGALALVACGGGGSEDKGSSMKEPMAGGTMPGQPATETNAAPVPCNDDSACPPGIACVFPEPGQAGYCDVNEMDVSGSGAAGAPASSAAPAPCTTDAECGTEIACKHLEGDSGPGFCDVTEMVAPGSGSADAGD